MMSSTDIARDLLYQIRLGEDSAYEFKAVECHKKKVSQRQNIIERRGEGIPKIMRASEQLSTRYPVYEQADEVQAELKLTIYSFSHK